MTSFMPISSDQPTAHRSVPQPEAEALDPPSEVKDLEGLVGHVEPRGDVFVDLFRVEDDPLTEHVEHAVGADEADELDVATARRRVGDLEVRGRPPRHEAKTRADLVGRRAPDRGVAVVGVVEALEAGHPVAQLTQASEALGAEEALVEGVIEVLERPLPPRRKRGPMRSASWTALGPGTAGAGYGVPLAA